MLSEALGPLPPFESLHPLVWWLMGLGGVSVATSAIWHTWIGPAVRALADAIRAASEIAYLLREVRDFMRDSLPDILSRLDSGSARFEEHESRISVLEEHVRPPKVRDSE